jgi:4-amino-4-deoxy-L-arabinose transferase-like glycosyltransferase
VGHTGTTLVTSPARQQIVLILIVVLGVIVPFSNRAVYMDEHIYLGLAQSALNNPMFPQDVRTLYFGAWFKNAADHTHPPVGEYHLALIYSLAGKFSETSFRLLFATPFAVMAVLGFYGLAARFTSNAFWVTLVFALSRPFFVMAPTMMMDVPCVGALLLGFRFMIARRQRLWAWVGAMLCFTVALGTSYTAALPLLCLAAWHLHQKRRFAEFIPIILPCAFLGLWLGAMTIHFGEFPLSGTINYYMGTFKPAHTAAATLSFIGSLSLLPWTFLILARRQRAQLLLSGIAIASVLVAALKWPSLSYAAGYFIAASSAAAMILWVLGEAWRRFRETGESSSLFLMSWFVTSALFFVFVADMMTARYLLLFLPPLYLLSFREAGRRALLVLLICLVPVSVTAAIADFRFVNSYRTWVDETVPPLQSSGFTLWSAAESGARFYLEQRGLLGLDKTDIRPAATDLIVRHAGLFRYSLADDLETMLVRVRRYEIQDWLPIRTFNIAAGAGFHDSRIGLLPLTFSYAPLDQLEITQVSPFATK